MRRFRRFGRRKRLRKYPVRFGGFLPPSMRSRFQPTKWIDSGFSSGPITAGGYGTAGAWTLYVPLNICTQGSAMQQRIGTKTILKSLMIRGQVTNGSTQTGLVFVRWMIVYDRQSNNSITPATVGDILDSVSTIGRTNLSNTARFRIIRDGCFVNGNNSAGSTGTPYRFFNKFIKLPNLSTLYNSGNTGNISDISAGSLTFYIFSDVAGNGGGPPPTNTNTPQWFGYFRTRFID